MCRPKTLLEDTMWSPEFNNAAIVEYTAAIPEAKAKPAVALPSYIFFHKLISVRVAVTIYLFKMRTHVFIFKYKTRVKYNGTECSKYWCVLIGTDGFSFKTNSSSFM
jgi:hypothetical protein